jgi:hypothetical protein
LDIDDEYATNSWYGSTLNFAVSICGLEIVIWPPTKSDLALESVLYLCFNSNTNLSTSGELLLTALPLLL